MTEDPIGRGRRRPAIAEGRLLGWVAMGGVAVMVAALWLPWHRSGERVRDAFELFDSAEGLDLGFGGWVSVWRWMVAITPVAGAVAWLTWLRRIRWGFIAASASVAVVVGTAGAVLVVATGGSRIGAALGLVGSVTAIAALTGESWLRRHRPGGTPGRNGVSHRSPQEDA